MWVEGLNGSGGGGGGSQDLMTVANCTYGSDDYYTHTVYDVNEKTVSTFRENYANAGEVHTYPGLTIQKTYTHNYVFTATDGYKLIRLGGGAVTDYGVNGTVSMSRYYSYLSTFIAIKDQ